MAINSTKGKFKIDFSDIPDNTLPAGEYTAKINKVELKEGAKAPYLNWEFDILDEGYIDRKVWMITSLADAALFRLKQVAEALGFEGGFDFEVGDDNMVFEPQFAGTEVSIEVEIREYQGQKRSGVKAILDYFTQHHLGEAPDEDEEDDFEDLEDEDDEEFDEFDDEEEVEEVEEVAVPVAKAKKAKA